MNVKRKMRKKEQTDIGTFPGRILEKAFPYQCSYKDWGIEGIVLIVAFLSYFDVWILVKRTYPF